MGRGDLQMTPPLTPDINYSEALHSGKQAQGVGWGDRVGGVSATWTKTCSVVAALLF